MKKTRILLLVFTTILMASCNKPVGYGDVTIDINYCVNGNTLVTENLCYTNEAGNRFMITEIQWFLSKIELQDEWGKWIALEHQSTDTRLTYATERVFYIDTNTPESQTLEIAPIPVGSYKTMRFTFGLDEEDNKTGLFTDSPEADMFWPDVLGGGYHYMKLNGKFQNSDSQLAPLAIHLGIGQNTDFTEYYQNYFIVELPIDFTVSTNTRNSLDLTMFIDNWFRNPNTIDFNEYGSSIMQNQTAQQVLRSNGNDVFMIGKPTNMEKDSNLAERFRNVMRLAVPKPHFWSWENVKEKIIEMRDEECRTKES